MTVLGAFRVPSSDISRWSRGWWHVANRVREEGVHGTTVRTNVLKSWSLARYRARDPVAPGGPSVRGWRGFGVVSRLGLVMVGTAAALAFVFAQAILDHARGDAENLGGT